MTETNQNLITARGARELAGPSVDEVVQAACEKIRKAAKEGKREVNLRSDVWVYGGYNNSKLFQESSAKLKELGFEVKFHYEPRQFVDMYTIVEW